MAVELRSQSQKGEVLFFGAGPLGLDDPDVNDVLGCGAAGTLGFLIEQRRRQSLAAVQEMRGLAHWADLHRVDLHGAGGGIGATSNEVGRVYAEDTLTPGIEGELRLAGEGAFSVTEFAVTEIAGALGLSESAARDYVGQALEVRDRLPKLWEQVLAGRLPAWKARQIAKLTIPLSAVVAASVDRQLAKWAGKVSLRRIDRAVEAAITWHDPALARERAAAAAEHRGVWIDDELDGISRISAVTGTPDARAFDQALNQVAGSLAALGDQDSEQVRRAKAVGVLADPQYALDLHATAADPGAVPDDRGSRAQGRSVAAPSFHLHLHTDHGDLADAAVNGLSGLAPVVRVAGLGARSLAVIEQWLADRAPGAVVRLTPVVDTSEVITVDRYEIPQRLHDQVEERETCCAFPWCGREGRFDLDHIVAFVDPDEGGPPGQTSTWKLARLCRFHHRVKTHGGWSYQRQPDRSLTWTSPLGQRYRVDPTGTTALL